MDADRVTVVAPGENYGPDGPLLMYAQVAAKRRGSRVRVVPWSLPGDSTPEAVAGPAVDQVRAVLDEAGAGESLLVGKSLGTLAAPLAARRGLAAVWFTPLLTVPQVVDGIRRSSAPTLLVGGTADAYWDGALARELSPHVHEVEGADHNLFIPEVPLSVSAAALAQVISSVEEFLDEVVWTE